MPNFFHPLSLMLLWSNAMTRVDHSVKNAAKNFVESRRTKNGGYAGRRNSSDIYYTSFAVRALVILGESPDSFDNAFRQYLREQQENLSNGAELSAYLSTMTLLDMPLSQDWCRNAWERFRRADGCFASSDSSRYSSTYHTFLAASCFALFDDDESIASIPAAAILSRQRDDGGFVELPPLRHSGTNPTAAAMGFLALRGAETDDFSSVKQFLLRRQLADGGFQAHSRAPVSDLLSSFSAFLSLKSMRAQNECRRDLLKDYVIRCRQRTGGYVGGAWDAEPDIEYTFYGLALEGLFAEPLAEPPS